MPALRSADQACPHDLGMLASAGDVDRTNCSRPCHQTLTESGTRWTFAKQATPLIPVFDSDQRMILY
jgi:hypothetical protein